MPDAGLIEVGRCLQWLAIVCRCFKTIANHCNPSQTTASIPPLPMKLLLTLTTTLLLMISAPAADAPYRHVVFFKFKDSATPEQVQSIEKAFIELTKKVDTVKGFEWGTNVSPENLNDGFTHCFLVTFADKAGIDVYLPHPAHAEFVSQLKPILDKACVLDYVAK
jgi:quinol monooxygenase YgiN